MGKRQITRGLSFRDGIDMALLSDTPESALVVAMAAFRASDGSLDMAWGGILRHLGRQVSDVRARLLDALPLWYEQASDTATQQGLLHLCVVLAHDLSADILVAERREAIAAIEDSWMISTHPPVHLAHAELDAGRALSPTAIATFRRSAGHYTDAHLTRLAARLTEPPLNVGEQWADAAIADLSRLRPAWRRLLAHAASVKGAKPSAKWEKAVGEIIDDIGAAAVHPRILSWLTLVDRPRSLSLRGEYQHAAVDELLDPFNAHTLRGLVWLLALMGTDAETVRMLGSLVDLGLRVVPKYGPRSPRLANAAVHALSRIGDTDAAAELRRLAAHTSYTNARRQIDAALAPGKV